MQIHDDHEVEGPEKITRFICGALLGVLTGMILVYSNEISSFGLAVFAFLVPIVGFGLLALYYGDRLWYGIIESLDDL